MLRIGVGILFTVFGIMKLMGGMQVWTFLGGTLSTFGITFWPAFWGFLCMAAELGGGLLLITGLYTRFAGLIIALTMVVAATHLVVTDSAFTAVVSPVTMLLISIFFLLHGGGAFALDQRLSRQPALRS